MPKVGSDEEALYENANFVYDGTLWVPMRSDANGRVHVSLANTEHVGAYLHAQFGGAWQSQNMLLGFADTVSEDKTLAAAAAGANTINGTAVPADEVWVIQAAALKDTTSATTSLIISAVIGGVACPLQVSLGAAANAYIFWNGELCLAPGDNMRFFVGGATLNDVLPAFYVGRKFYTNL